MIGDISPYAAAVNAVNGAKIEQKTLEQLEEDLIRLRDLVDNLYTEVENPMISWQIKYYKHIIGFTNGEIAERKKPKKHPSVGEVKQGIPAKQPKYPNHL